MNLLKIQEVAKKANIPEEYVEPYGFYKAKIDYSLYEKIKNNPTGKLILVTAITPTKAGEGKTTMSIALQEGFGKISTEAMLCLREPALGLSLALKAEQREAERLPSLPVKTSIFILRGTCMR